MAVWPRDTDVDPNPRRQAQQRVDRVASFREELAELEREGGPILTPEQRIRLDSQLHRLLTRLQEEYGVDADASTQRISWGMRMAAFLGGAALMAATILFLHRIWGNLLLPAHVLILVAAPLLLLGGAEICHRRGVDLFYTWLFSVAAGVSFVTGLNALGAILNLTPSPHSLLAWALFALLVAYAYGLRLPLAAGLVLACAYTAALAASLQGKYWPALLDHSEFLLPGAVILYLIPGLLRHPDRHDFGFVYRACGAGLLLVALLMLSISGHLCWGALSRKAAETLYQIVGTLLSAGMVFHGVRWGRSGLVNVGAVGFVMFLYLRLHDWLWDWMPKYLFFLLVGLTALALLLVFFLLRTRLATQRRRNA